VALHRIARREIKLLSRVDIARLSLAIFAGACASSGTGATARSNPDAITRAEVNASNATNAYELIGRLRPNWLRATATGTIGGGSITSQAILVYLDRQRLESLDALKTLSVDVIDSASWLDPARVQTVLPDVPSGPIAGAIVIRTRK
jgi:hypothetical protein